MWHGTGASEEWVPVRLICMWWKGEEGYGRVDYRKVVGGLVGRVSESVVEGWCG